MEKKDELKEAINDVLDEREERERAQADEGIMLVCGPMICGVLGAVVVYLIRTIVDYLGLHYFWFRGCWEDGWCDNSITYCRGSADPDLCETMFRSLAWTDSYWFMLFGVMWSAVVGFLLIKRVVDRG